MQTTIALYITVSCFWQLISLWVGYLKILEKAKTDYMYRRMLDVKKSYIGALLKDQLLVPAIIILGISVIIASPILFPIELFRYVKRLFFAKSKAKKSVDAEDETMKQDQDITEITADEEGNEFKSMI
jgi:hypothetical protein